MEQYVDDYWNNTEKSRLTKLVIVNVTVTESLNCFHGVQVHHGRLAVEDRLAVRCSESVFKVSKIGYNNNQSPGAEAGMCFNVLMF